MARRGARAAAGNAVVGNVAEGAILPPICAAFLHGLAEAGYVDGKNVAVEDHGANFNRELLLQTVADLIRRNVSVIFAAIPAVVVAARNGTTSIPIVTLDLESDPVAVGYIKSLARPGGNMTGMFLDLPELSGKQVGLLKEIVPGLSHIAVFGVPALNAAQFAAAKMAVQAVGLEAEIMEAQFADDLERALEAAATKHVQAGILLSSPLTFEASKQIGKLALAKRLPLISLFAQFPKTGGLIAYGPSISKLYRTCGGYVGRVLAGATPSELPIQRPEKFDLVINLRTAEALGIFVPYCLLPPTRSSTEAVSCRPLALFDRRSGPQV